MLEGNDKRLAEAWKTFMERLEMQREEMRMIDDYEKESIDDSFYDEDKLDEESYERGGMEIKLAEEIRRIVQKAKEQGEDVRDIVAAVLNAAVNKNVDLLNPAYYDIILDVVPEVTKKPEIYAETNQLYYGDFGNIFKTCAVGIDDLEPQLLLNREFMSGYVRTPLGNSELLEQEYIDAPFTNADVIKKVNEFVKGMKEQDKEDIER